MTDKQALKVLKTWLAVAYQNTDGTDESSAELYEALQIVFSLITRQQAEIEDLKIENQSLRTAANSLKIHRAEIKSEAVKKFAERLKEIMFNYYECVGESAKGRPYKGDTLMDYEVVDMIEDSIDNLVKEMEQDG